MISHKTSFFSNIGAADGTRIASFVRDQIRKNHVENRKFDLGVFRRQLEEFLSEADVERIMVHATAEYNAPHCKKKSLTAADQHRVDRKAVKRGMRKLRR